MLAKQFSLPEGTNLFTAGDFQDAYIPELLQSMLLAYKNDDSKYVWTKIFPIVAVKKAKGKIANLWMQAMAIYTTRKGWKGWANKIEFWVRLDDERVLEEHALYTDIYKTDIENADAPIDAQRDKMFILKGSYDLAKEYACLSQIFDSNVITNNVALSGTDRFDSMTSGVSNSDPISTLYAQAKLLKDKCWSWPTEIVLSLDVMVAITNNTKVIDRFKYTTTPTIPSLTENLKNALWTQITISEAQKWDGAGDLEGTLSYLVEKKVFMCYNEAPGLYSKWFGKTFTRRGSQRVLSAAYPLTEQLKNSLDSLVIVQDEYDMHIIDQKCARLITTVIS